MRIIRTLIGLILSGAIGLTATAQTSKTGSSDKELDHDSHHHHHAPSSGHEHTQSSSSNGLAKLQINNGKKWATDAALRREMAEIRTAISSQTAQFHQKKAEDEDYGNLAQKIQTSIQTMFKECKLPPSADANLHIILAEMLSGVSVMQGKDSNHSRAEGLLQVTRALEAYGRHFEDPHWKPLKL